MRFYSRVLPIPNPMANGNTTPVDVSTIVNKSVQMTGVHASTVKLQGSVDGNTWYDLQTLADTTIYSITQTVKLVRLDIAGSNIADTLTVTVCGHEARSF